MLKNRLRSVLNLCTLLALCVSLLGSAMSVTPVYAATFTVTKTADTNDGACDADCSLREAITAANANVDVDTISVPAGTYTLTLGSQLPAVTTTMTITGNGEANTIVQADAAANTAHYRVFEVTVAGNLTLNDLTVRNGVCDGSCSKSVNNGGGLYNEGVLSLAMVTFRNNNAAVMGGGVNNQNGSLTLNKVTFDGNDAMYGGGLNNSSSGSSNTPSLTDVTFSNNTATSYGGGMDNMVGSPTLTNVTFSNNQSHNSGGGMFSFNGGIATLNNVTFSNNTAINAGNGGGMGVFLNSEATLNNVTFSGNSAVGLGGGIYVERDSKVTLKNVIIANSTSGGDCVVVDTSMVDALNSLIEDGLACVNGTNANNLTGDPKLDLMLKDNGGFTQTHALLSPSPAIDAGTNTGCTATDQRGVVRPQDGDENSTAICDIGTFEYDVIVPTVTMASSAPNPTQTSPIAVVVQFSETVTGFTATDITPGNGTVNNFLAVDGDTYTFDLTLSTIGMVTADIAAGSAKDLALNDNSTAPQFSRAYAFPPTITSLSPDSGPMAGGSTVVITGTNLTDGTVTFGGTAAACTVNSVTQITCTTPALAVGTMDVVVTTLGGTATSTGGFTAVKADQSILFSSTAPTNAAVAGATYTPTATGGASGNPVVLTIDVTASSVCSISGGAVSFQTVGTCIINANQAGNTNYNAAPQVQQSFVVHINQTLTVSKSGTGSGTVTSSPAGINCGVTCSYAFAYNTSVTLTATPTSPSTFGGWSGGGCSGTGTCTVTMSAAQSVTATFTAPINGGGDTTGVFRPSNALLYLKNQNTSGFADVAINYGTAGDYPIAGDWDGNGTATIGIYRNGSFYLRNSNTLGFADLTFAFGQPGDQPVAGDWDGDGIDTIGVYSNGQFLLRNTNTAGPADMSFYLGNPGDVGIAGDWNGDGMDTTGVFRPGNGVIFLKNLNTTGFADININYGLSGDMPITGDWDNDGIDTIGVYRNAQFLLRNSNTVGFADMSFYLGNPGDMPISGNWDGVP